MDENDKTKEMLFTHYVKQLEKIGMIDAMTRTFAQITIEKDQIALVCLVDIFTAMVRQTANKICKEDNEFKSWTAIKPGKC